MSNTGNFVLSEAMLVVFITCITVSIATSVTRMNFHTEKIIEEKKMKIAEQEREGLERWRGCEECIVEETVE